MRYKFRVLVNLLFALIGVGSYFFMEKEYIISLVIFIVTGIYGNLLGSMIMNELKSRFGFLFNVNKSKKSIDNGIFKDIEEELGDD